MKSLRVERSVHPHGISPAQTIAALDKLTASGGPVLKKEAEEAKKAVQAHP